jgi:hypothetical protein
MDILAERLGLPFEKITKRGGDSWIVTKMESKPNSKSD